jgi:hypothetical protein
MPRVYYEMPVPSGFGKTTLDYIGCANGRFFAIETKAPGGKPTERQKVTMAQMRRVGAKVFVINDAADTAALEEWLHRVDAHLPIEGTP